MRQRPEDGLGIAGLRQRQRLARQPFQITVLAHVDHCLRAEFLAQESVEGKIAMRRHEIGRVIAFFRINIIAARRLDTDQQVAEPGERQRESAIADIGISLRHTPTRADFILNLSRKRFQEILVSTQGKRLAHDLAIKAGIGRPQHQVPYQRIAITRNIGDRITGLLHRPHHLDGARRRIQTDAIAEPSVTVRIVRHDERNPPALRRHLPEPRPVGGKRCHIVHAPGIRLAGNDIGLDRSVVTRRRFEGYGARQHPAIHLRQRDIHAEITRREPLR